MSRREDKARLLFEDGDVKVEAGEYGHNRRYEVEQGTKFIQVTKSFRYTDDVKTRSEEAVEEAWKAAQDQFGAFRHEQVDIAVIFVTCQVLVEFRVRP